jgi:hypothetical protein
MPIASAEDRGADLDALARGPRTSRLELRRTICSIGSRSALQFACISADFNSVGSRFATVHIQQRCGVESRSAGCSVSVADE